MQRILIFLPSFSGGGGERTIVNLLEYYDRTSLDIKVGLMSDSGPYMSEVKQSDVLLPKINLNIDRTKEFWYGFLSGWLIALNQFVHLLKFKPDVYMTVTESMNFFGVLWTYYPFFKKRPKWIIRVGNNALAEIRNKRKSKFTKWIMSVLLRWSYRRADMVVAISAGVRDMVVSEMKIDPARVVAIYNPVNVELIREKASAEESALEATPYIIGVGRLEPQKRFDILIRAFAKSSAVSKGVRLVLLGNGSQKGALEKIIDAENLSSAVTFKGFQKNPFPHMKNAAIFVLSSQWEGYAHVVAEAMACETPVIVTNCDFGPKEIVTHQKNGMIVDVNSVDQMAGAIDELLNDPEKQAAFKTNGLARARDFSANKIINEYDKLFRGTLKRSR